MSRVVNVPIFYATEEGILYLPASEEAEKIGHDVEEARERLSNLLKNRKLEREKNGEKLVSVVEKKDGEAESSDDEEDARKFVDPSTDLAIRRIEQQLRVGTNQALADRDQAKMNRLLARSAMMAKGNSKAISSTYVHKEKHADNAAARAVVHHTGSHYVMAGGKQFQKGLRVKGVISRHSKQGAKLQAARTATRNMSAAREDARGERAEGGGRSEGKQKNKKKNSGTAAAAPK
jgi:hypothetical protein